LVKWDKEGHFIFIKGAKHQKEITIINLHAPNVSVPSFITGTQFHTLKDLKAHIDSNTVIVGDFSLLPRHGSSFSFLQADNHFSQDICWKGCPFNSLCPK
jgi:hypothetical protein